MSETSLRPRYRSWAQPVALALAALLWAAFPVPTVSALVWAYLLVWLGLAVARGRGHRWAELRWPTGLALGLIAAALAPALFYVVQTGPELIDNAQLEGRAEVFADRARLEAQPTLHPPVLHGDQPQALWVFAPGAREVRLQLGPGGPSLDAADVGGGRFRARYDPRRDGPPAARRGQAEVQIDVDGASVVRNVAVVAPRVQPRRPRAAPGTSGSVAVSTETDELLRIDGPGEVTRWPTADGPVAAAATSTRAVWVAHRFSEHATQLDLHTGSVLRRVEVGLGQTDVVTAGAWVAITVESPPAVWLWSEGSPPRAIALSAAPDRAWFAADGRTLVVSSRRARSLTRVRLDPDGGARVGPALVLGRPVVAGTWTPSGRLVVAVSDLRPEDDAGDNHAVREQLVEIDVEGWRIVGGARLEGDCAGITDLTLGPSGIEAACAGSDTWRDGAGAGRPAPLVAPEGIVALRGGARLFTSAAAGQVAWSTAGGEVEVTPLEPSATAAPSQLQLRRGARAFLEATRSGTSCATCHPASDSDHALHDIGHGRPRPTLSVLGLAGTSPFLRGASYPTLRSLEPFTRDILGGFERPDPDRIRDLEAYVLSLPPPFVPARAAPDTEARLRAGLEAFSSAGCDGCHSGAAFTDLAQYPSQVLFPDQPAGVLLDTPSLIGVSSTPPYLFDGRAKTLRDVFERADPRRRHGRFDTLDEAERAALFALLEVL